MAQQSLLHFKVKRSANQREKQWYEIEWQLFNKKYIASNETTAFLNDALLKYAIC